MGLIRKEAMMFRGRLFSIRRIGSSLFYVLLILGLTACNRRAFDADDREEAITGGESDEVELGQLEQALWTGECPQKELFGLKYDHEYVLNMSEPGEGSELHLEWNEEEPAVFSIHFDVSGKVSNDELGDEPVNIIVEGWVKTSDSDCPIAYLDGIWPLTADIQGTCKDGIVKLHVTEHFEDVTLNSTCDGVAGPGPGLYSAPEVDLTFDLSVPMTNDGIMYGSRDSHVYAFYWYELSKDSLELVPLVPDS
jgi:hypothetical protein